MVTKHGSNSAGTFEQNNDFYGSSSDVYFWKVVDDV
jgi:hypothetical protein